VLVIKKMAKDIFSFGISPIFTHSFASLKDYRRLNRGNLKFPLQEIIFLTVSAVVSNCTTYEEIAYFGTMKLDWLRKYFPYSNGTPSHDTLGEFYSKINPKEFGKCLILFMEGLKRVDSHVVAIDGKTVRGSISKDGYPLHILTAFCTANKMSLGEETVSGKENEITAIPRLLSLICLEETIVTIDAIGCQTEIATFIRESGADYILQVKGNQKRLLQDITETFSVYTAESSDTVCEVNHGRVETRKCSVISHLDYVEQAEKWTGLYSLVKVESEVYDKKYQTTTHSQRYYISSCNCDAKEMNASIRSHWQIESFHWSLDVVFKEDNQAKRNDIAIENANLISKFCITLLTDEKTVKKSKPLKRLNALMDDGYRQKILKL
jgi:predicted transposase YbfD/YdcC